MVRIPPSRSECAALCQRECWIFDLDNTLYSASTKLFSEVDRRITEYIARFLSIEPTEARDLQKRYFREYGTSMRGLMDKHKMEPGPFLDYVHDIDLSRLQAAKQLDQALSRLSGRKIIFTNADLGHARRVLAKLDVAHHFEAVFDIADANYRPKPEPAVYDQLIERFNVRPAEAVMVEDIAVNLAPAAALGMATVWVRAPEHWGNEGASDAHVHHVVDDLPVWLETVTKPD
ncbi:MAG: pyrimidine 5'-nucleotidase [Rhodospirillales bacterium]|nr:pyrimidine 5'-nucleotidase [Rhodospirillales bacterium]